MTRRVINYISTRANYVRRRINLLIVEFQPDRVIEERVIAKYIFLLSLWRILSFFFDGALRRLFVLVSFASKTFPSSIKPRSGKNIFQEMRLFFFLLRFARRGQKKLLIV